MDGGVKNGSPETQMVKSEKPQSTSKLENQCTHFGGMSALQIIGSSP
jgi:hypothetical protein